MADEIRLDPARKAEMIDRLTAWLASELDLEVRGFDAEFLLDFVGRELGSHYYNQGLLDAQAAIGTQLEAITEAIELLERPV